MEQLVLRDISGQILYCGPVCRIPLREEAVREKMREIYGPGPACFARRAAAEHLLREKILADALVLGLNQNERTLSDLPPGFLQAAEGAENAVSAVLTAGAEKDPESP